jgi:23S rRNA pseudouridine1911/1915/1917 synthase
LIGARHCAGFDETPDRIALAMKSKGETTFHVNDRTERQTLAAALRRWMPGKSWTDARRLIAGRRIQINGNLCMDAARKLKRGDVVKLAAVALPLPAQAEHLRIRYLDEHIVVVEKPTGVTTMRHPEERFWPAKRKQLQPTLDELLPRAIVRESGRPGGGARLPRVRPVHRLDRDTSGLMVFARAAAAEHKLIRQFKRHTIHRLYQAIVVGEIGQTVTYESTLVRDRGDGRRGSARLPNEPGKRAITHVAPLEAKNGYTLVECRLETGRTHQIRIHLAEAGHPVCGEKVYGKPPGGSGTRRIADKSRAPRIMLHAAELGFVHPITKAPLRFVMPMPADMATIWKQLRGD